MLSHTVINLIKFTEEISDLIRFRNQCQWRWGRNKNRELKNFVNKLTKDIRLGVFCLSYVEVTKLNWWNVTKLLKNKHRAFPPLKSSPHHCFCIPKRTLLKDHFYHRWNRCIFIFSRFFKKVFIWYNFWKARTLKQKSSSIFFTKLGIRPFLIYLK
jgi:hypothetical protein